MREPRKSDKEKPENAEELRCVSSQILGLCIKRTKKIREKPEKMCDLFKSNLRDLHEGKIGEKLEKRSAQVKS